MKNSFLSGFAGWLAGAVAFAIVGRNNAGGPSGGWLFVGALYSAPFVLVVWLACLWPLYALVPSRSLLWRPAVCIPTGACVGALLYFCMAGSAFDWRVQAYFASLHVFVGAVIGAVSCAVGVAVP